MDNLREKLTTWHTTRSVALASEICNNLHELDLVDTLFDEVVEWGRDRGINNPAMQFAKLNEEVGEIAHELTRKHLHTDEMADALGDTLVVLIILADILGYDLRECLKGAYDVIKDRRGRTEDGNFIKEENGKDKSGR